MSLGTVVIIDNIDRKFGADQRYGFLQVRDHATGETEHWLVTVEEAKRFLGRARKNREDNPRRRRGLLSQVDNTDRKFGANPYYHVIMIQTPQGRAQLWMLSDHDLNRIRERVQANREDIEANQDRWTRGAR